MSAKHALIVDDSKSARITLSRMLQQYDIEVDMAESAEEAIEYLQKQRPDAIFMDHQMPGMDGLQAVKIIKNDPRTATIPIMMYTSQEGELYVGQARALGAVGVLPKHVEPTDMSKMLDQLNLLPNRRDRRQTMREPKLGPADPMPAPESAVRPQVAGASGPPLLVGPSRPSADRRTLDRDVQAAVEPLLRAQFSELRRLVIASLDGYGAFPMTEMRDIAPASHAEPTVATPRPARPIGWMMFSAVASGALLVALSLLWRQDRDLDGLRARLATAESAIAAADARDAERAAADEATRSALQALLAAAPGAAAVNATANTARAPRTLSAAAPAGSDVVRVLPVGYGEAPFAGARLEALRALTAELEQRGVSGIVHVTSYAADFCLTGNTAEGYVLAPDGLPASSCDLAGNPADDALRGPQRESHEFSEFVAVLPNRSRGALSIVTREAGHAKPSVDYPPTAEATAGQWNAAAIANQRVEISFAPNTSPP